MQPGLGVIPVPQLGEVDLELRHAGPERRAVVGRRRVKGTPEGDELLRQARIVAAAILPAQPAKSVENFGLMIGVIGTHEKMNIDGSGVVVRRRNPELDVGNEEIDAGYPARILVLLELGIVRDGEIVRDPKHADLGLSFDRGQKFVPVPELVIEDGVGGVNMQIPPAPGRAYREHRILPCWIALLKGVLGKGNSSSLMRRPSSCGGRAV